MAFFDDLFQRGYRESQEQCAERLASLTSGTAWNGAGEVVEYNHPLTEDLIVQAADPLGDGGWGGWLTADDHSWGVLNCEPFTEEWQERNKAYVAGAERGAADWVELQLVELDAKEIEAAVRTESSETVIMPREIMADWLEDRDDPRAAKLRHAINPPALGPC